MQVRSWPVPPLLTFPLFLRQRLKFKALSSLWAAHASSPEPVELLACELLLIEGGGQASGYWDQVKLDSYCCMNQGEFQKDQRFTSFKKKKILKENVGKFLFNHGEEQAFPRTVHNLEAMP